MYFIRNFTLTMFGCVAHNVSWTTLYRTVHDMNWMHSDFSQIYHTHTHTRARVHTHTHMRAHTHTHTHARAHTHMRAHTHTHTRARTHTRTHISSTKSCNPLLTLCMAKHLLISQKFLDCNEFPKQWIICISLNNSNREQINNYT